MCGVGDFIGASSDEPKAKNLPRADDEGALGEGQGDAGARLALGLDESHGDLEGQAAACAETCRRLLDAEPLSKTARLYEARLALRHGVTVANAPGTVDSDYRGEVMVILVNLGAEPYTIRRGDRIAQLAVRLGLGEWVETRLA